MLTVDGCARCRRRRASPAAACGLALPVLLLFLLTTCATATEVPVRHGFWGGVLFGYGSLDLGADQAPTRTEGVFAMSFRLGLTPHRCLQLGVELGGWLLEAFDVWDPSQGESVSQTLLIAQIYPWPSRGWFLKAGTGRSTYTNEHPLAFDSGGWAATIGAGCDWRLGRDFALTPVLSYSRGSLGDVHNPLVTVTGREYDVIDFGVALTYP